MCGCGGGGDSGGLTRLCGGLHQPPFDGKNCIFIFPVK